MKSILKRLISKYFGDIQYVVTIINVSLSVQKHKFNTMKQVDEFVDEINNETYWMVQKIEKIRMFDLKYDKKVKHTPLHFQHDAVTEMYNLEDWDYTFLKKDESLKNIIRSLSGELDGLRELWYDSGQLKLKANYKDGKLDGLYETWYENGQLLTRANYENGKLNGLWETWYKNGQLMSRANYKNGKLNGLRESWYENGKPMERETYKDGKPDGLYNEWDENGNLVESATYKDGVKQ